MVLVTGGTGFLGSYIIKQLVEKGYNVRALRRSNKLPFWIAKEILEKVEWVEGDVLDVIALENAMNGVDTIIHSAAIVSFATKDRKEMYQVNVEGTANVVNIALEKNVRRLVHISSVAALGRTANGGHVNEEKKWEESKVNTHYAKSKFKAELQVWRGISEGLEAVILNPSTILGYGDWHSSSCAIFKSVHDGFNWYTPGINGFVDVEDVAKATIVLMESTINEQRFIVNGDSWTFKKLQDTIADGFSKKRPARKTTPFLLGVAWRMEKLKSLFTRKKPLLTKESARVAQSQTWFENDKILKALQGFSFTPLEETIKKACEKYTGTINTVQP
ncbi:MAG: SDR family NAD(P)-dependent oxidoreductase [Chitinophagaceae bacterium]|jgi:nucleoside-diphosphate-sugar epimerase|nr:SDR family NAD(P)-dependent oxidoreductase [Chitinophagaceae bacterium]MBK8300255.1 SDR family NAD(P)-dependent oxidoreductase [Chitinophagaceae bacterium]MBK9464299.1 SDR family NAD(P)-dependent oxidoreductase [Chitinophagaceae bacterium]MBK9658577.1 SDR family NAD(P)-dependent oxidoreductase [Chitinophagaceae bacterium]MBK9939002.1 SDR family NAD(P)-dependent oxidoreductase [Chitinophagaceae bacterium]